MNILDDIKQIKNLDKSNLLGSVRALSLQLEQTRKDLDKVVIPSSYKNITNILVNGMGGSRLGGRVAQRLFENNLNIPIYLMGNYELPAFVNSQTLYIISSYSGNTEEPLTAIGEAKKRKAKILVLAQNGKLSKIAKNNKWPGFYDFNPQYNPCNQPRMSIGYQILGIILLLAKCHLLTISDNEINNLINFIRKISDKLDINVNLKNNLAKQLSNNAYNKIICLVGAEFLMGALHVWKNQINENAKQLALKFEIPELDHHLLEGMQFPESNSSNLYFIFCQSKLYHPRNCFRIEVTKKVLNKYKINYQEILLTGQTKLAQVFEIIQIGEFIGFYLSMLNKLDPSPVPWVDYFKKELDKL